MEIESRSKDNAKRYLILGVLLSIGFQQFPVLHVGGSLKIYEMLGLVMLWYYGVRLSNNIFTYMLFAFFVISPILSLMSFYMIDGDVASFYRTYRETEENFRFNIYIFPLLQLLFMIICYVVYSNLYYNRWIYRNFEYVKKWIVIVGTCIAIYSVVSMFIGDVVTKLPGVIQNKHIYEFRSSGFSQEPSFYILYQGWIVLLAFFSHKTFNTLWWILIMLINILALIFTFSSTLVVFAGVVAMIVFVYSKLRYKLIYLALLAGGLSAGYIALSRYVDVKMLNYAFIDKIEDFIFGKDDAGGSGGFRHYESTLGWIMFKDNPVVGVGVGNSIYYMHVVDKKSSIIPMDEQLHPGSFPPNTFACVFAEQGVVGGGF